MTIQHYIVAIVQYTSSPVLQCRTQPNHHTLHDSLLFLPVQLQYHTLCNTTTIYISYTIQHDITDYQAQYIESTQIQPYNLTKRAQFQIHYVNKIWMVRYLNLLFINLVNLGYPRLSNNTHLRKHATPPLLYTLEILVTYFPTPYTIH